MRLRGYAKFLADDFANSEETAGKMQEWRGLLQRWLWDTELDTTRDLMVKYHVVLALKNLTDDPFNETSHELFKPSDWVI